MTLTAFIVCCYLTGLSSFVVAFSIDAWRGRVEITLKQFAMMLTEAFLGPVILIVIIWTFLDEYGDKIKILWERK